MLAVISIHRFFDLLLFKCINVCPPSSELFDIPEIRIIEYNFSVAEVQTPMDEIFFGHH